MEIHLSKAFISEFESEVEKQYKKDKATVGAMRALLETFEKGDLHPRLLEGIEARLGSKISRPITPVRARRQTLASKVTEVCRDLPDRQWTAREMVSHLGEAGFPVGEKTVASVSGCLWKLARDGELEVVRRGAGNRPSVYRWKTR